MVDDKPGPACARGWGIDCQLGKKLNFKSSLGGMPGRMVTVGIESCMSTIITK